MRTNRPKAHPKNPKIKDQMPNTLAEGEKEPMPMASKNKALPAVAKQTLTHLLHQGCELAQWSP